MFTKYSTTKGVKRLVSGKIIVHAQFSLSYTSLNWKTSRKEFFNFQYTEGQENYECSFIYVLKRNVVNNCCWCFTLIILGEVIIIILCWKITISPETNLRWTSNKSVNLRLSVVVQNKKKKELPLSRLFLGARWS